MRQSLSALPKDSTERKDTPIFSGVIRYFPLALAAVARLSKIGNDKHNPNEPVRWSREKSSDHGDCLIRHQIEFDEIDQDSGEYHAAAVVWRALAQLQLLEEQRLFSLETSNGNTGREIEAPTEATQPYRQGPHVPEVQATSRTDEEIFQALGHLDRY